MESVVNVGTKKRIILSFLFRICLQIVAFLSLANDSAFAQITQVLTPIFKNIYGGVAWVSRGEQNGSNNLPVVRGGFALIYGTTVPVVRDSSAKGGNGKKDEKKSGAKKDSEKEIKASALESFGDSTQIDSTWSKRAILLVGQEYDSLRVKKTHQLKQRQRKIEEPGPITLAVGYQYGLYHTNSSSFQSRIPVDGFYLAGFYRVKHLSDHAFFKNLHLGVAGELFSLSDVTGTALGFPVKFSSEKILAPEIYLVLSTNQGFLVDVSYQYLKFSSIRYAGAAVAGASGMPAAIDSAVPKEINLTGFHVTVAARFNLSGFMK